MPDPPGGLWQAPSVVSTGPPAADSRTDDPTPAPPGPTPDRVARWTYGTGLAVFGVQFVGLVVLGVFAYRRFTVGKDFGVFNQAWSQIGSGHLYPYSTIQGAPYLKNHFELIMWPLALLHPVVHSAVALVVVQILALVGAEMVAFTWVTALVRRAELAPRWSVAVSAGTVVLLVASPGSYASVVEDFHFEAFATLFVLLAAYDLWSGRTRRMWAWLALCLLCGDIGGLYALGLGLSALVVRDRRRPGALVLLAGLAWTALISLLGANLGSNLSTGYAYLAGRATVPDGASGLWLVTKGALLHPGRAVTVARPRVGASVRYLLNGGGIGAVTPWGFGIPLVVLGTSVLQSSGIFIGLPYQNYVILPFVTFGSAWMIVGLATRARWAHARQVAAGVGVAAVLVGVATSAQRMHADVTFNASSGFVSAADAAALGRALAATPADAEVAAPLATLGRFSQRRYAYLLGDPSGGTGASVPVRAPAVVVVVDPSIDTAFLPAAVSTGLVRRLEHQGATVLVSTPGVTAVLWHPPPGVTSLHLVAP